MNTEVLKKTISFLEELHASNDQHFATNLCEDPLFHYKQDQIVNLLTDLRRELVLNDSQEITFDDPRNKLLLCGYWHNASEFSDDYIKNIYRIWEVKEKYFNWWKSWGYLCQKVNNKFYIA